jgi:pre-mRNA-splicing factor 18
MDFSSLMAKEIAKKKAAAQQAVGQRDVKYVSKAELERQRIEKYREEQDSRERERQDKLKRRLEEQEEVARERALREEKRRRVKDEAILLKSTEEVASLDEVISKLRKLKQPVTLFSETDDQRVKRLYKIERTIAKEERLRREEQEEKNIDFTIIPEDIRDNQKKVYVQLRAYIKHVLKQWEEILGESDASEKAYSILDETNMSLQPLFILLREESLDSLTLPSIATLLMYMQKKNYRLANDAYVKLSIGNAAWPIGITDVTMHERSALDRITGDDDQTSLLMSSEVSRKWLTSIKRLLTFAEGRLK